MNFKDLGIKDDILNILTLLLIGLLTTSCSPTKTYNVEDFITLKKKIT